MKNLFSSRVKIVLLIAVLLAVVLAVVSNLTGLSLPDIAVKGILTPVRSGVSMLVEQAQRMYNYMFEYEALAAENAQLKEGFFTYAMPLIQGEILPYYNNGLPRHLIIDKK